MNITGAGFMLNAADMARGVAFYRDTLGLKVAFESPEWSELRFGDATIALHGGADDTEDRQTGLYFDTDDIASAVEEALAGGATLKFGPKATPEEGIILADVRDPEGNVIGFCQRI